MRHDRLALNQAGIAKRCPLPRTLAVEQQGLPTAQLQLQGNRYADNAGSQDDDSVLVGHQYGSTCPRGGQRSSITSTFSAMTIPPEWL
jgi:hypothetical protein